jgi:uncharacterized membrane protein (UPF0127 family)
MKKLTLIFISPFVLLLGCNPQAQTPTTSDTVVTLPTTNMTLAGKPFVVEKATTPGEQEVGLMRRNSMAEDHGMIFIFPIQKGQTFWNHDVRFPLDVVFMDHNAQIVSIQHMLPYDDTNTEQVQAQYVIELNSGEAAKLGLKIGDTITLPDDAKAP